MEIDPIDSPSRQLLYEFSQMLINSDRDFNERLDLATAERAKLHQEELARAAAEHERVRQSAERARQRHLLEEQKRKKQQEDEENRALERARQEKLELEIASQKRKLEEQRREEIERKQAAERAKQLAENEARLKAQKQKEEAEEKRRAEQVESDRKASEAAAAVEKARAQQAQQTQQRALQKASQQPPQQPPKPSSGSTISLPSTSAPSSASLAHATAASPLISSIAEREAHHEKYLGVHKRLKEFRKNMVDWSKQNPNLKGQLGDARRSLRTRVGQITGARASNTATIAKIREALRSAANAGGPMVDIRRFIVSPTPQLSNDSEAQFPGFLLYLLNHFAKSIIAQFVGEASNEGKIIDAIGVIGISIFADEEFKWRGISLIDVLIAKFHAVCPVLWGIYGHENTQQGKQRLGWARAEPGGPFVTINVHNERMLGLGSGFASLTLRNFSKNKKVNPWPNTEFWRALTWIVNTPSTDITSTHLIVLKSMLADHVEKFITIFGHVAVAALRTAVIDFPARAPASESANMLKVVPDVWKKNLHLTLE